jgi:hypothetical protein
MKDESLTSDGNTVTAGFGRQEGMHYDMYEGLGWGE